MHRGRWSVLNADLLKEFLLTELQDEHTTTMMMMKRGLLNGPGL